jgi:hypothetical protein
MPPLARARTRRRGALARTRSLSAAMPQRPSGRASVPASRSAGRAASCSTTSATGPPAPHSATVTTRSPSPPASATRPTPCSGSTPGDRAGPNRRRRVPRRTPGWVADERPHTHRGPRSPIRRFKHKDAFAHHNGTAPLPAWSGNPNRHRLSRQPPTQRSHPPHRHHPAVPPPPSSGLPRSAHRQGRHTGRGATSPQAPPLPRRLRRPPRRRRTHPIHWPRKCRLT